MLFAIAGCQALPLNRQKRTKPRMAVSLHQMPARLILCKVFISNGKVSLKAMFNCISLCARKLQWTTRCLGWCWKHLCRFTERRNSSNEKLFNFFEPNVRWSFLMKKSTLVKSNYDSILVLKKKADEVLADSIVQMIIWNIWVPIRCSRRAIRAFTLNHSELFEYVLVDELEDAQEAQVEFLSHARSFRSQSRP